MTDTPVFLAVEDVLAIHRRVVTEFGGAAELRDRGLLESAVRMPMAQFGGSFLHDGLPAMAAAYLFHLCGNHAFADGNKRVALASAEVFLHLNGLELAGSDEEVEDMTRGVAESRLAKEDVISFFRRHVRPTSA